MADKKKPKGIFDSELLDEDAGSEDPTIAFSADDVALAQAALSGQLPEIEVGPESATVEVPQDTVAYVQVEAFVQAHVATQTECVELAVFDLPELRGNPSAAAEQVLIEAAGRCPEGTLVCVLRSADRLVHVDTSRGFLELPAETAARNLAHAFGEIRRRAPDAKIGVITVGRGHVGENAARDFEMEYTFRSFPTPIQFVRREPPVDLLPWLSALDTDRLSVFPTVVRHALRVVPEGKPDCTVLCFSSAFQQAGLTAEHQHEIRGAMDGIAGAALRHGLVIVVDNTPFLSGERPRAVAPWWSASWSERPGVEFRHAAQLDGRVAMICRHFGVFRPQTASLPTRVVLVTDRARAPAGREASGVTGGAAIEQYLLHVDDMPDVLAQARWLMSMTQPIWDECLVPGATRIKAL